MSGKCKLTDSAVRPEAHDLDQETSYVNVNLPKLSSIRSFSLRVGFSVQSEWITSAKLRTLVNYNSREKKKN